MSDDKTPKKLYSFDDHPEHKEQLKPHADWWIANALSCKQMDDEDRAAMLIAMPGLYQAANLEVPKFYHFCDGPVSGAFASAIAAGVWWIRENPQHHKQLFEMDLTNEDLLQACWLQACEVAVEKTGLGTECPQYRSVRDTVAAVVGGILPWKGVRPPAPARDTPIIQFFIGCIGQWERLRNGGNQWSPWVSYLAFFRHVAKLDLPEYEKFQHYEKAAIHAGPRYVHKNFWVACDRPLYNVGRDDQNRPHCETGPQLQWRDGYKRWYISGVRVNEQIVMRPETLTPEQIDAEQNAEVKRVMLQRYGWGKYMEQSNAKLLHKDEFGELYRKDLGGDEEPLVMVKVINSTPEPDGTFKPYMLRVRPDCTTAREAVASTWIWADTGEPIFKRPEDYAPAIET